MKNIFLSQNQINKIREMQKILDNRIKDKFNLHETDLSLEKFLAIKTELFELINEIESFKWWKTNKGKDHILEEACDVIHFLFSMAIDNDIEIIETIDEMKDVNLDNYDINDLLVICDTTISDIFINKDYNELNLLLYLLSIIIAKCGFNANDLYNQYMSKNKENHIRQDNNY